MNFYFTHDRDGLKLWLGERPPLLDRGKTAFVDKAGACGKPMPIPYEPFKRLIKFGGCRMIDPEIVLSDLD